jgi:hypothetical protein
VSQFLGTAIFLIIVAGLALHAGAELPWFAAWIGTLPGDIVIKKNAITILIPLTSSLIISAVLSIFFSIFSKN